MEIIFMLVLIVIIKAAIFVGLCAIGYRFLVFMVKKFLKDIKPDH